ncbi:hypothetical protein RRG08_030211 [Elysia crispata]|uniref:Uncharacterized protein n=1 Tax=Elysia crispata TaxID=231223 RepID=A0AAE1ASL8_9GAST|nr:hypothetical protein RRG08_030211 [Elysia crispata]
MVLHAGKIKLMKHFGKVSLKSLAGLRFLRSLCLEPMTYKLRTHTASAQDEKTESPSQKSVPMVEEWTAHVKIFCRRLVVTRAHLMLTSDELRRLVY